MSRPKYRRPMSRATTLGSAPRSSRNRAAARAAPGSPSAVSSSRSSTFHGLLACTEAISHAIHSSCGTWVLARRSISMTSSVAARCRVCCGEASSRSTSFSRLDGSVSARNARASSAVGGIPIRSSETRRRYSASPAGGIVTPVGNARWRLTRAVSDSVATGAVGGA